MWKWIILALCGYVLYRLFANDIKKKLAKQNDTEEVERKVASGDMVKDPECGTYIDKDSSITVKNGETIHRFCSYDCRDAFLEKINNGGRVIEKASESQEAQPQDTENK